MRKSAYTSLFTLLAFWFVASFAQAAQVVTEIKDGAKVYIRYNAGTASAPEYYYWSAGQNYGTTAITSVHGVECTLKDTGKNDGSSYLHLGIANGDGTNENERYIYWDSRFKCDKGNGNQKTPFTFVKVSNNVYTIKFGTNTVNVGSNPAGDKLQIEGSTTQWEVVTKEQLKRELEDASPSNPVDATFFISDPGFGRNVVDTVKNKWKIYDATSGDLKGSLSKTAVKVGNTQIVNLYSTGEGDGMMSVLKISNSDGSLYKAQQTLTGLPNGKYRVSVQGSSKNDNVCYLFADNGNSEVTSSAFTNNTSITDNKKAYDAFTSTNASDYVRSVEVQVLDGTLTIGVKNNSASPKADVFVDNFELYCLEVTTPTFYNPIGVAYTPEAVDNSPWKELTTSSNDVINHPEKYFFTVWVNDSTLLGLKNGEDGEQGSEYKTMGCFSNVNPLDNKVYLWELYRVGYLKYVFVNPTSRENMVQTEDDDTRYFRFSESTAANTTNAIITVQKAENSNWMLKTSKGQCLRPWDTRMLDVIADSKKACFKIYAIPRASVVVDGPYEQIQATLASDAYTNSNMSFDASLLMSNSDAMGTNDDVVRGWTNTGNVKTVSPVAGENGRKSCFTFPTSSEGSLSQTLNGMHAGVYTLTAHVIGGKGTLFIGDAETAITGAGTFEVEKYFDADNCDVSYGARVGSSSESALQIDYFTLRYSISKDFYVRKNIGSESEPEYLYVAGGTHNNNVVMAKHGTEFTAVGRGASTLSGFEDALSVVLKTGTYTSSGNIGYLGLDANNKYAVNIESANKSNMLFRPVDATNKYYYMYSASNNKYVGGSNTLYSDLTQSNSATTPFELVSRSQLLEELKNALATPLTPVDATFLIDDPDFSKGNMKKSSWKVVVPSNGNSEDLVDGKIFNIVSGNIQEGTSVNNNNGAQIVNDGTDNKFIRAMSWVQDAGYKVQQTITGLPNGWYRVSAQGLGTSRGTAVTDGVSLYLFADANDGTEEKRVAFDAFSNIVADRPNSDIEGFFAEGKSGFAPYERYKKSIEVHVTNGSLTIGAKSGDRYNATSCFDNFELYYIGKRSADSYAFNLTPVDFSVNGLNGNMVEVTSATDDAMVNPQNYFFTIWENSTTCLALANGTAGYQGADYKTMSYGSNPDLANDLSCLWEFYKTADGKFVMINAGDREHMMQTEEDADFFRYNDATTLDVAKASVEFQPSSSLNNWIINTPKGYVHRWNKNFNDIVVDEIKGYHKIYAIPRRYYVMDVLRAKYGAYSGKPKDVTLLLANPEAAGTSGSRTVDIPAWDKSGTGNVITKEGDSNAFNVISGKSFFQIDGSKDLQISQTVSNLLAGKYRLCVSVKEANVAYLYVGTKKCAFNDGKYVSNGTLSFEFECDDNASVTYGVKLSGKSTTGVQFDNFRLYYLGDPNHIYADPLTAGEGYYIRALNSEGEYRYLEAGNSWGTAAVFTEHGIEYKFEDANATQDGYPLYYLNSGIVGGRGQYLATANGDGTGGFFNDSETLSWYFIPRGDEYPFQYRMVYKNNGKNVTYDKNITSGPNLVFTDTETYVEIVPKYVRMIALEDESVSYTNPVDATFLIKNPSFGKNDIRISEWKANVGTDTVSMAFFDNALTIGDVNFLNGSGASSGNSDIYSMKVSSKDGITNNVSFNFFQKITDVPNGHYIISASGVSTKAEALRMYVTDSKNAVLGQAVFVDTDEDSNFKNVSLNVNYEAFNQFFNNNNQNRKSLSRKSFAFDVKDSTMVIGFRGTAKEFKAFFDNVELKYCGPTTDIVVTNLPGNNFKPEKVGSKWVEVSMLGSDGPLDNPGDYLFTIWKDKSTCLALTSGTDTCQGSSYKTMAYTNVTADPINNLNQLWEIYQNDYGVKDGKFVLVNASSREMMMQAEEGTEYFRFRELVSQKNDKAVVCINDTILGNGSYIKFKITSDCSNRELGRWSSNVADVKMVDANGDYYKLYAIKRADYYTKKYNILYTANIMTPTDVSLLLKNPDAMGELDTFKLFGWNINTENEMSVSDTVAHKFAALDGKGYFEYRNSEKPKTKMSQTIKNVIRGYYLLGVSSTCAGSNAILYVACNNDTINEELSAADPITHVVYVPIYVEKDGSSIDVGIDLTNYTHKKNSEDDDDTNASYIVKFDHFTLQYMGVSEVLASALADGTYFIRTNKNYGTDMSPEYMYLEAGGNKWGTDPILSKHGFAMELTKLKDGKYSIKNPLYQSGGGHGSMFDGLHFDHAVSQFTFQKVNPNDEESYEYWMYSHKASTNISGSEQTGLKGYMIKDNDNSLSLLDVSSAPTGEESAIWEIVTKTQRIKELQDATYENPMDATFFITDPSFGRNNTGKTSWQFNGNSLPTTLGNNDHNSNNKDYDNLNISIGSENPSGDTKSNKYDYNVKVRGISDTKTAYNLTQKVNIDNLPAGLYRLSVHGYTNTDGGAILYAANEHGDLELCELNKVNGYADAKETDNKIKEHRYAAYWFTGNKTMAEIDNLSTDALNAHKPGEFKKEIEFKVLSNTIIIGVRGELKSEEFAMIDNFELYYLGEAAQDLSKLSEPVERYIYNVDAGKYLNDENDVSQLKQLGRKYYIQPVAGKTDRFYIYTKDIKDKKSYISPYTDEDDISYVKPNNKNAYEWIIKKASTSAEHNYIYEISDNKGRLFESTGDAANVAYLGFADDKEPRCTRWSFYEAGQYQKDRVFTTLASATRTDMWRILRAAKVNHRDLTGGYAVAGLEEAMDRLDAVWTSPMASKLILEQKASDMKNLMIASTTTRGSEKMPLDVSFYIQNAGLGDKIGWANYDAWKTTSGQKQSHGSNSTERIVSIEKFLYAEGINVTLTQTIKNVPAGKYKLAVDLRTRTYNKSTLGSYRLFMNADGAEPVELSAENYSNTTIKTFITDNYIELDKTQDLIIGIQQTSGTIAFDNFKLYFCGNVKGKLKLNSDSTELTVYGDWDRMEDLTDSVNKLISETKESLGVVYAYKSDFILSDNLNVTAVGWQGGDDSRNNVLFYTDYDGVYDANDGDKSNYKITGASNVVRKNSDGSYTCDNLVITDRMTMHVPYEFTASSVSYSRSNKISTGTLCLPFDLTKLPTGINKFYKPESIDWDANPSFGKLIISEYKSNSGSVLPANTPVLYDGVANGTISVNENNSLIHKTSELQTPKPENDDLTMYGTYQYKYVIGKTGVAVDGTKNSDGLSADVCYYVKTDNNSLVRGNHWFNIGAFRAFVYRGKGELNNVRPSVLYVDFDNVFDAVNEIAVDDAVVVGYYDVQGVCYDKPQNGLNIVLYSDGTRRKIYVK